MASGQPGEAWDPAPSLVGQERKPKQGSASMLTPTARELLVQGRPQGFSHATMKQSHNVLRLPHHQLTLLGAPGSHGVAAASIVEEG